MEERRTIPNLYAISRKLLHSCNVSQKVAYTVENKSGEIWEDRSYVYPRNLVNQKQLGSTFLEKLKKDIDREYWFSLELVRFQILEGTFLQLISLHETLEKRLLCIFEHGTAKPRWRWNYRHRSFRLL